MLHQQNRQPLPAKRFFYPYRLKLSYELRLSHRPRLPFRSRLPCRPRLPYRRPQPANLSDLLHCKPGILCNLIHRRKIIINISSQLFLCRFQQKKRPVLAPDGLFKLRFLIQIFPHTLIHKLQCFLYVFFFQWTQIKFSAVSLYLLYLLCHKLTFSQDKICIPMVISESLLRICCRSPS